MVRETGNKAKVESVVSEKMISLLYQGIRWYTVDYIQDVYIRVEYIIVDKTDDSVRRV